MIRAFVGPNGSGKTLAMVAQMAFRSWAQGRVVVSNFRLFPERVGFPQHLYRPLESWLMIPRLGRWVDDRGRPEVMGDGAVRSVTNNKGVTLLLDEITSVLPARDSVNVPPELQRMLNQFRKPDVWVGWSAPAWLRADIMLREVTFDVCESAPVLGRWTAKYVAGSAWPQHRLFRWRVYDAFAYETAVNKGGGDLRPLRTRHLWRPPERRRFQAAYNTLEGVGLLDHIQCGECGGKFARRVCRCAPAKAAEAAPRPLTAA